MGLFGDITAGLSALNPIGLLGTAASVAGPVLGFLGQQQTNSQNASNVASTNATVSADTEATNAANIQIADNANALSTEFAQNGLSWKIADAAKNGISPLAAIGAVDPSINPAVPVLQTPAVQTPSYTSPLSSFAAGIPDMSQNISRALASSQTPVQKANDALDLAYKAKQNDLLDLQIAAGKKALVTQPGTPPGMPSWTTVSNLDGSSSVIPTEQSAQASHGEPFGGLLWQVHNGLIPVTDDLYTNVVSHGAYGGGDGDTIQLNYR